MKRYVRSPPFSDNVAADVPSATRPEICCFKGGRYPQLVWRYPPNATDRLRLFGATDTIASMADYNSDDRWQDEWMETVHRAGKALREEHLSNPWRHIPALPEAMKYLATEL
jgi:hypothetical protein